MHRISYVQFLYDISGVGSFWSRDKHGREWELEEKGMWVTLTNTVNGQRRRVPMTSVTAIHEAQAEGQLAKGKGA